MNELLQKYLERADRFNSKLHVSTVKMPREPKVTAVEKILDIPPSVWDNKQYGDIDELIEYLRRANNIPSSSAIEVAFEESSRVFRMKFNWWEIVVLTDRNGPGYA